MLKTEFIAKISRDIKYSIDSFNFSEPRNRFLELFFRVPNSRHEIWIRIIIYKQDGQTNIAYIVGKRLLSINNLTVFKRILPDRTWEADAMENILHTEINKGNQIHIDSNRDYIKNSCTAKYACTGKLYPQKNTLQIHSFQRHPLRNNIRDS